MQSPPGELPARPPASAGAQDLLDALLGLPLALQRALRHAVDGLQHGLRRPPRRHRAQDDAQGRRAAPEEGRACRGSRRHAARRAGARRTRRDGRLESPPLCHTRAAARAGPRFGRRRRGCTCGPRCRGGVFLVQSPHASGHVLFLGVLTAGQPENVYNNKGCRRTGPGLAPFVPFIS